MYSNTLLFCILLAVVLCSATIEKSKNDDFGEKNSVDLWKPLTDEDMVFSNQTNATNVWILRKFCLPSEDMNVCMEVGMKNGQKYTKKVRVKRSMDKDYDEDGFVGYSDDYYDYDDPNRKKNRCKVKTGLKTVELRCKVLPRSTICKAYCAFGKTFEEGIVRTMTCNFRANKWSNRFEECSPFVDCSLHLTTPGVLKCITNSLKKPDSCLVECDVYEDRDPVPKKVHECTPEGKWKPPLPYCVKSKGADLVRTPSKRVHTSIDYP